LIRWAADQLAAANGREARLKHRGIHASYLQELQVLIETIRTSQHTFALGAGMPPPEVAQAQRIREEAYGYWQEAKQIVKVEFGSNPDMQAKFHPGVRSGRLIANLTKELHCIVSLLGEHSAQLGWLGVTETFQRVGVALIANRRTAQAKLESACKGLPAVHAEYCLRKGRLYDLTRKLVRIGRLEFMHEPEQASAFNYAVLRWELRAGSEVRMKSAKPAVH
jgi:hypothetical protein